jgi:hypothetical protein
MSDLLVYRRSPTTIEQRVRLLLVLLRLVVVIIIAAAAVTLSYCEGRRTTDLTSPLVK